MKRALQAAGGLALAALLLLWVLHGKDPKAISAALVGASLPLLALGGAINLGHNVFRTWRWGLLLDPVSPGLPFRPMFSAIMIGYLVSWIVPARLGEVVRPALLSAKKNVPLGASLGSVVADRLLDGVALAVLFAMGAQFAAFSGTAAALAGRIRTGALVLAVAAVAFCVVLVLGSAHGSSIETRLDRAPRAVRWAGRVFVSVAAGSDALRRPRLLIPILAHSLLAWLTIALGTWLGMRAARAEVGFADVLVLLLPLAFGIALPTPGGAGGYHAAVAFGLTGLFGVPADIALGAGILMHLAIVVPVLALGPILLRVEQVSWHDVLAAGRHVKSLGAGPARMEAAS